MTEDDYHRYIRAFNARDYDRLETFFADGFVLENAGFRVRGKAEFRPSTPSSTNIAARR